LASFSLLVVGAAAEGIVDNVCRVQGTKSCDRRCSEG
jgi:hypothetical protein